jgi:hypothetical protein
VSGPVLSDRHLDWANALNIQIVGSRCGHRSITGWLSATR